MHLATLLINYSCSQKRIKNKVFAYLGVVRARRRFVLVPYTLQAVQWLLPKKMYSLKNNLNFEYVQYTHIMSLKSVQCSGLLYIIEILQNEIFNENCFQLFAIYVMQKHQKSEV